MLLAASLQRTAHCVQLVSVVVMIFAVSHSQLLMTFQQRTAHGVQSFLEVMTDHISHSPVALMLLATYLQRTAQGVQLIYVMMEILAVS